MLFFLLSFLRVPLKGVLKRILGVPLKGVLKRILRG